MRAEAGYWLLACLRLQLCGFPQNPAAISIPGEHSSLMWHFPVQSPFRVNLTLGSPSDVWGLFGGETFMHDFGCEWSGSDLQPIECKLPTWISAPWLLCVIRKTVVKVGKKQKKKKGGGGGGRRRGLAKMKEREKRVKSRRESPSQGSGERRALCCGARRRLRSQRFSRDTSTRQRGRRRRR